MTGMLKRGKIISIVRIAASMALCALTAYSFGFTTRAGYPKTFVEYMFAVAVVPVLLYLLRDETVFWDVQRKINQKMVHFFCVLLPLISIVMLLFFFSVLQLPVSAHTFKYQIVFLVIPLLKFETLLWMISLLFLPKGSRTQMELNVSFVTAILLLCFTRLYLGMVPDFTNVYMDLEMLYITFKGISIFVTGLISICLWNRFFSKKTK